MLLENARLRLQRQVRELRSELSAAKQLRAETRDLLRQSQVQANRPGEPPARDDGGLAPDPSPADP